MFWGTPGQPTKLKKGVYLVAAVVLGLLLSFLIHSSIEMSYLSLIRASGITATFYGQCALLPVIQASLWFLGAAGGFFLGKYWWRKLYVERVWVKK